MPYASTEDRRAAFRRWYAKNRTSQLRKRKLHYWSNRETILKVKAVKYAARQLARAA